MRLAYLATQYPKVSHTFIRREILELERRGHDILRVAVRRAAEPVVEPADRIEEARTLHILSRPWHELALAVLRTIVSRPQRPQDRLPRQ